MAGLQRRLEGTKDVVVHCWGKRSDGREGGSDRESRSGVAAEDGVCEAVRDADAV